MKVPALSAFAQHNKDMQAGRQVKEFRKTGSQEKVLRGLSIHWSLQLSSPYPRLLSIHRPNSQIENELRVINRDFDQ